jgi:proteasome accessory factor C
MGAERVREEGLSKDADKLVRRLSLVALLLSKGGQPVGTDEIRTRVEGYPLMTEDAFKRRFYEDRAELALLGIEIVGASDEGGVETYRLPADAYYLPPVELSQDELSALGACLAVLEDRFSYSQPLRLALLSLAQGRPELLTEAEAAPLAIIAESGSDGNGTALPKLQRAVADRKTVLFDYYAISRDETTRRCVDPYGLQLMGDEWYLIGRCHLRQDLRTFRLSRIRSRITHATRAPHDFATPEEFDLAAFRDRPPWQLSETRGCARIRIDAGMAWWVEAHWSHCGTVRHEEDGGIVYETDYADAKALMGWVLGMGEAAQVVAPAELREQTAGALLLLRDLLAAPPPAPAAAQAAPEAGQKRRATRDWRVEVDHFTRLTALAAYLLQRCADDEVLLDVCDILSSLDMSEDELRIDIRLLNLVNFGADGALLYAEHEGQDQLRVTCDLAGPSFRRPSRLSPLQADTLLLAIDLVGGRLPARSGGPLASAADKLRAARHDDAPTISLGELLPPDERVLQAVNQAIKQRRLLAIEYWAEGTGRISSRTVEPYLLLRNRGEWYYVCWCRKAEGTRMFRIATTKQAELLDEAFEPREEVELDLYRREGIPTTRSYSPRSATIWCSPRLRRWMAERQPVQDLADGSCLTEQPYGDESWLVHHLLRFAPEARPLAPPPAVEALRSAVTRILSAYGRE